ncbi:MAG: YbaK/EbsC family protein [Thaumarchaeota archaeon]|nr:YbaK/EbsC family protein [Nitrososphaerota archaeon]
MGSRERVAEFLLKSGAHHDIREFAQSTKNSALAAEALGCTVAEIAKSVVFVGMKTAVVIVSGDRKVDTSKLGRIMAEEMRTAKPDEVRERTGFPIGGVPPFPHAAGVEVLPDMSLTRFREVWAAAGAPNAVFKIGAADLIRLVGRGPYDLAE